MTIPLRNCYCPLSLSLGNAGGERCDLTCYFDQRNKEAMVYYYYLSITIVKRDTYSINKMRYSSLKHSNIFTIIPTALCIFTFYFLLFTTFSTLITYFSLSRRDHRLKCRVPILHFHPFQHDINNMISTHHH